MSSIKVNVKVVKRTDLAWLVSYGGKETWVPLHQIKEIEESSLFGFELTAITIPTWLATDKGLQAPAQDTDTVDMFRGAT